MKFFFYCIIFFFYNYSYCQAPKEVVFDKEDQSTNKSEVDIKYRAVNISIVDLLYGDYILTFEHKILNKFVAEIGFGLTNQNFLKNKGLYRNFILHIPSDVHNNFQFKLGHCYSFDLKYFFGDIFKTVYCTASFQQKVFNISGIDQTTNSNSYISSAFDVYNQKRVITDFTLGVGYKKLFSKKYYADVTGSIGGYHLKEKGDKLTSVFPYPNFGLNIYYSLKVGMFF